MNHRRGSLSLGLVVVTVGVSLSIAGPGPVLAAPPPVEADYNGDGYSDLAIGNVGDDADGVDNAGAVNVLYGSELGATSMDSQILHQDSPDVRDVAEDGDGFGAALASGDFDGDDYDDLAVGVPFEDVFTRGADPENAGVVQLFYGSASGLVPSSELPLRQGSSGIPGDAEDSDRFGYSLAAGNLDRNRRADLVVGAPNEDIGGDDTVGSVTVLLSGADGVGALGAEVWHQDQKRLRSVGEGFELLGIDVAIGNLGKSGHGDLVLGVSGEDIQAGAEGAVHVLYGSDSGPRSKGQRFLHQNTPGIPTGASIDGHFGEVLEIDNFGRGRHQDLAVAAPDRTVSNIQHGSVYVLYGSSGGVTTRGARAFHQNTPGVRDKAESSGIIGESFGNDLGAGDVGRSRHADLVIGVPYESVGDVETAGAAHVLFGSRNGVSAQADLFLTQEPAGIPTEASEGDHFGAAVSVAEFGETPRLDVAISATQEDIGSVPSAGAVFVLDGAAAGPDPNVGGMWSQANPNVEGDPESFDHFGSELAP